MRRFVWNLLRTSASRVSIIAEKEERNRSREEEVEE
jgi:hypothetical protein